MQRGESTLYLFNEVYHVPLLSPELAATMATSTEQGLSVLLALGLLGSFAAAGLFILNLVAVISYVDLSQAGINPHFPRGILLGVLLILSSGEWSFDNWIEKNLAREPVNDGKRSFDRIIINGSKLRT